jgi:predicted DNA-binding transcriptional regulator AlpA
VKAKEEQELKSLLVDRGYPEDRVDAAIAVLGGDNRQDDRLLTLKELCKALRVSETTVWRHNPPSHRVGARKRYKLTEVLEFMDDKHRTSADIAKGDRRGDGR